MSISLSVAIARRHLKLDCASKNAVIAARLLGVKVAFVSPYQDDNPNASVLDSLFAGHSLCQEQVQYYHGFSALAPPPVGNPAGQTTLLHWNRLGQGGTFQLIKNKVPTLVP